MNDDRLLDADDLGWRLAPVAEPCVAPADPSTADERGLLYADISALETRLASVTADCASYRELAQTALDRVAALTLTVVKQSARIADQAHQIRAWLGVQDDRGDDWSDPAA